MAHGLHWEWRGFGGVSSRFAKNYSDLPLLFEPQEVEDLYLWVPGLHVNAKFRTGAEGGLKFKRIKERDGTIEKWYENPEELFDFPLNERAWATLCNVFKTAGIHLPENPGSGLNRQKTLDILEDKGCKTVLVKKNREARSWQAPGGIVKVEWACISEPQPFVSIGLENLENDESDKMRDETAKKDLAAAINTLELNREPLNTMNYMKAVEVWAGGNRM